jgi:alkyl sulfatase BDS1-like metallo-beta-lactamase superfamily hydrolase
MKIITSILFLCLTVFLNSCSSKYDADADSMGFTKPTSLTEEINARVLKELPLEDQQDFKDARRGLIASMPELRVKDADGNIIWDMNAYAFIQGKAPSSVNPSLWRQSMLNNIHGLFKVTEGIYQLRGFCISNMTIIEGKAGWIIVDPLTSRETASTAIAFARKHLKARPITAIIYTHSHIDHFGGVLGVISPEEAASRKVMIIAPKGFMDEATKENVIAGNAMARRAEYQFGTLLTPSKRSHIDTGLGKRVPFGEFGILPPTVIVDKTPQEMKVDGVRFIFQYAPESEAPAELTFYLPDSKAFCGAEVVSHNMHNLYTLRGTKIRDSLKWSGYIEEAINLFGKAEICFICHHWPIWGNSRVIDFLEKQRDMYKYMHDQTMRLANAGYTPREISEQLRLPDSLAKFFPNRGYYGTLSHNVKAVYQAYLGWYDGNPANLNPLPPVESAKRYVEYMGGAEKVLAKAQSSFDKGEYRWVAEVLNHLVYAEPGNDEAKQLLARAYDQLGYQSESGVWRNVYLSAAYELRHGPPQKGMDISKMYEVLIRMPVSRFFDTMAVRLNGPKAEGKTMKLNIVFTDIGESHVLTVKNSVLRHRRSQPDPRANVTLRVTHGLFVRMITGKAGIRETVFSDNLSVQGSRMDLVSFLMLMDNPQANFNIVEP